MIPTKTKYGWLFKKEGNTYTYYGSLKGGFLQIYIKPLITFWLRFIPCSGYHSSYDDAHACAYCNRRRK